MKRWLVDTGPLVAYLDPRDREHPRVVETLDPFVGRLVTTGAVVTEAMHFLAPSPNGPGLFAELAARALDVHDLCQPAELRAAVELTAKYADTPMDFADATLLLLAEALGVAEIATLDRRGFSIYRTRKGKRLSLVLG